MGTFWGDDLLDSTQGLDILGIRGLDQSIEMRLVNGITTISQRARYLSILTWSIGEFLTQNAHKGYNEADLEIFLRRVEFIILAATKVDHDINGGDFTGALGSTLYSDEIRQLASGATVPVPSERGGAILGTYFVPCKSMGLLMYGDHSVPYKLTPRGKAIFDLRSGRLGQSPFLQILHNGGNLTRDLAEAAIPEFSLSSLVNSEEEARLLREALTVSWEPNILSLQTKVNEAYRAFNGTIDWAKERLREAPNSAPGIIVDNFKRCVLGKIEDPVALDWAEYEYRRRCHLGLELLLSSLTRGLQNHDAATADQVIGEWAGENNLSPFMEKAWPSAGDAWESSAAQARESVQEDLFLGEELPARDLRKLAAADQALAAVAILSATAKQTQDLRGQGWLSSIPGSAGEQGIKVIEEAGEHPFGELLRGLLDIASSSHLQNTLRKMGAGQKCSLRFFPEGPFLRPTGIGMTPGYSGDRLTNVLRMLADIGALQHTDQGYVLIHGGAG